MAIAAGAVRYRRWLPGAFLAAIGLFAVLVVGGVGAMFALQPPQSGYGPSAIARAEIPPL